MDGRPRRRNKAAFSNAISPAECGLVLEVTIKSVSASLAARDRGATGYEKELLDHPRDAT